MHIFSFKMVGDVLLRVQGLCKRYKVAEGKEIEALRDVSFEVQRGETLGIIGKSGAGKTTLLRILRGHERFDEGVIELDGIKITPDSPYGDFRKLQEKTAFHLQRCFSLWNVSVLDNVIKKINARRTGFEDVPYDPLEYEELKEEALKILDLVGMREKHKYFFPILSGGEKQKVLLARQLAKEPSLLLLDEPTTMTDPLARKELLESVKRVKEKTNMTIIVVSHMPEVHRFLADRLLLLERGSVADEGDVERILRKFMAEREPAVPLQPLDVAAKLESEPILHVKDLFKKYTLYTSQTLIKTIEMNIDFKVARGEILGVVGPSAMGKTVLMRMLSGIERPDEGDILFNVDGKWVDITTYGKEAMLARSKIGIMHQEFGFLYGVRVWEMFAHRLGVKSLEMLKEALKRAKEKGISEVTMDVLMRIADLPEMEAKARLEEIGLGMDIFDEIFPKYPISEVERRAKPFLEAVKLPLEILYRENYDTSVGERVRIGRALHMCTHPELLLLDEPFGDLDPISLRAAANALKEMNRRFNTTMLVVSHQLEVIEELCHEAILIDDGGIVMRGSTKEVCDAFLSGKFRDLE